MIVRVTDQVTVQRGWHFARCQGARQNTGTPHCTQSASNRTFGAQRGLAVVKHSCFDPLGRTEPHRRRFTAEEEMLNMSRFKMTSFIVLIGALAAFGEKPVQAAYFDCTPSVMQFKYYGQEVECSEGYQDDICDAGCDYCFGTASNCIQAFQCTVGVSVRGDCTNGDPD
jgi:hypothetical protein